jgi:helicase MOV-10
MRHHHHFLTTLLLSFSFPANQLGPIITSDLCKKFGLGVSYMERLLKTSPVYGMDANGTYRPHLVAFLARNYRSHPAILKLPNEMFYYNKLIASGDHFVTHNMTKWEHLPNRAAGFPVVFHSVDGENQREGNSPSWFNPQEAILIVETVGLLVKHSRPAIRPDEIGVITPYARQVQKIQLLLKARDMGDVKVGSVETFQGQERRCIIISTVRSENDWLQHDLKYNLGFVANEKRFNVAVTRAKALLYIIGNPRVLQTDSKNWLPLLRYFRDNKSWQGQEWDEADDDDGNDMEVLLKHGKNDDEEEEDSNDHSWQVVTDQEAQGYINREE